MGRWDNFYRCDFCGSDIDRNACCDVRLQRRYLKNGALTFSRQTRSSMQIAGYKLCDACAAKVEAKLAYMAGEKSHKIGKGQ